MRRVTFYQRLIASDRFFYVLIFSLSITLTATALIQLELTPQTLSHWSVIGWAPVVAVLAFGASWFASGLVVGIFLAPFRSHQALRNGSPYAIGDRVQIISGRHSGTVSKVYEKAQHDANRVDLGKEAKDEYSDIFSDAQLLRCDDEKESQVE